MSTAATEGGSVVNATYTVEADIPNVEIAYEEGRWERFRLSHSDAAGRYAKNVQATPREGASIYLAIRGSTSQSCRIRINATVVSTGTGRRRRSVKRDRLDQVRRLLQSRLPTTAVAPLSVPRSTLDAIRVDLAIHEVSTNPAQADDHGGFDGAHSRQP